MTRERLQLRLNQIEAFVKTEAHETIMNSIDVDIAGREASILQIRPATAEDMALLNQLHGELDNLRASKQLFETARTVLKNEIAKIDDLATESPTKRT